MNCKECNKPLEERARFCPNCGTPITTSPEDKQTSPPGGTHYSQEFTVPLVLPASREGAQPAAETERYIPPSLLSKRLEGMQSSADTERYIPSSQAPMSPSSQPPPLLQYRLNTTQKGAQMLPAVINTGSRPSTRNRLGCAMGCLATILILLLILGAGWLFAVRPYLHNIAQGQLDQAMTSAVNQIPPQVSLLPPGPFKVQEDTLNNLIVLNLAPSNPVQHPATRITPGGVRLDFDLYGYHCAIAGLLKADNGRLVMSNVSVEGIIGLIMSPDEMTTLLNKHLSDAQDRMKRVITGVQLRDHEMSLVLS